MRSFRAALLVVVAAWLALAGLIVQALADEGHREVPVEESEDAEVQHGALVAEGWSAVGTERGVWAWRHSAR